MRSSTPSLPVAMTIATSDSGCGAGVQADLLSFAARGVYGLTAFAALTAQNPDSVRSIFQLSASFLKEQCEHNDRYYDIAAIKTGMLFSKPLIEAASQFLRTKSCPIVVDPVMVASSGAVLLKQDAIEALEALLPLATLVTPNLDEACVLLQAPLKEKVDVEASAATLARTYQTAFLIKGGHGEGDEIEDVLLSPKGQVHRFKAQRQKEVHTHGSGCTLSAAITAELAKGQQLPQAVKVAHSYLQRGFARALRVGGGAFIAHFP